MARPTLGTTANNTLSGFVVGTNDLIAADVASLKVSLKDDIAPNPLWPSAYGQTGKLFIPNRGVLICKPGDFIGVDATGWPILLSATAAANANWVHVP